MTTRILLPLYLCLISLPSFAADSGGVETWSPVIRPGAPNRPAKIDEQEKRRAESKLHALTEENQRLKGRLERALEPTASKEAAKPSPVNAAPSGDAGGEFPSELEDMLRRSKALKDKNYAAYLTPPFPLFLDGFYFAYGPFKEKASCLDYFAQGENAYPLQLNEKPAGNHEYYCYFPYLWSNKSQSFTNRQRRPDAVLLQMSREGATVVKNW